MKQMTVGTLPARMLIRATDVALGYEGHTILEGIHFTVSEGEYLCIVGENGSGKSTLMKAILGLHPLAGGSLEIAGSVHAAGIGYLPQQTPAQRDFPASVREVVLSGCLRRLGFRPFFGRREKRLAADAMARLGIRRWRIAVTATCPADSSSASCWRGHSARRANCCCWTSLLQVLTRWQWRICTVS